MTTHVVLRSLVVLSVVPWPGSAVAQTRIKDACALLKPAEVQALLAPNAKIDSGVPGAEPRGVVDCTYEWGAGTADSGVLFISVFDPSKMGENLDWFRRDILQKVRDFAPNASEIPGIGDGAVFWLDGRYRVPEALAEAYFKAKRVELLVSFDGGSAPAEKDQLIALLKLAAGRL